MVLDKGEKLTVNLKFVERQLKVHKSEISLLVLTILALEVDEIAYLGDVKIQKLSSDQFKIIIDESCFNNTLKELVEMYNPQYDEV